VNIPSLNISKITNQSYTGYPNDTFSRFLTLTNTATSKLTGFTLFIVRAKDVQVDSLKGKKYTTSGDTMKVAYTATDFLKVGNKDRYLDKNEVIVLREYNTVKGCSNLTTKYILAWGCNGKFCDNYSTTGGVVIGPNTPSLSVSPDANQDACYANNHANKQSLIMENNGNGPAYNVVVDVFQTVSYPNGFYDTVQSRIDANSLTLKYGTNAATSVKPDTAYGTTSKPCLNFIKPKGRFLITIPLIKAGETVVLSWDVYTCCLSAGYVNGWGYEVKYSDQCKSSYTTNRQLGRWYSYQSFPSKTASTKDLVVNDTIPFSITNTGNAYLLPYGSKPMVIYEISLPKGVTLPQSSIYLENSTASAQWKPDSIARSPSKVIAYFDPSSANAFDLSSSTLQMKLGGDTSGRKAKCDDVGYLKLTVKYIPDKSCNCSAVMSTDSFQVKLNCNNPSKIGLINLSFGVSRVSYGKPDNNDDGAPDASGSLDFSKIRTDRAMYGDTIELNFKGVVKTDAVNTIWHHGIAEIRFSDDYFTPVGFDIRIVDSTNKKTYTCSPSPYFEKTGSTYKFWFHYDTLRKYGCGLNIPAGYRYRSADSINIKIRFRVSTNIAGTKNVKVENTFYFATKPKPTKLKDYYYVNNFPGSIIAVGYYHTNCCYNLYDVDGCGTTTFSQSYYLSIGACCSNYNGGNMFPYEYRYWSNISSFKTVLPKGYNYVSSRLYYYPTQGTGKYGIYSTNISVSKRVGDTLFFNADSLFTPFGGSWMYSDDGYAGTLETTVQPTCAVTPDAYELINYYQIYRQDSKLSNTKFATVWSYDQAIWKKPSVQVQSGLQSVNTLNDTLSWRLFLSNLFASTNINKGWLAFESPDGKIKVDSLVGSNGKKLKSVNGIHQLDSIKGGTTKTAVVKARISSCVRDSIKVIFGWNCGSYPDSVKGYGCPVSTYWLYADPQKPSVQVKAISAPDTLSLCDTAQYVIEVTNTKTGFSKEADAFVSLVPGTQLVKGSFYLSYDGAGYQKISDPDSLNPYLYRFRASSMSSKLSGKGLSGILDTAKNHFRIMMRLVTNCDYISGSFIQFRASSYNLCGQEVNKSINDAPELYLEGATPPYYGRITMRTQGISGCGQPSDMTIKVLNQGPGSTDSTDQVFVTVPAGIKLDTGYFKSLHNSPLSSSLSTFTFGAQKRYGWSVKKGIVPADSVVFGIRLMTDSNLACGTVPVLVQSTTLKALVCIRDSSVCLSKIETGKLYKNVNLLKPSIKLGGFSASALPSPPDKENITVKITLTNNGDTLRPGVGQVMRYYFDSDGNKKLTSADKLAGTDTLKSIVLPGKSIDLASSFKVAAGYNCSIFAYWDSSGTNCSCSPYTLYQATLPISNAGKDTLICNGDILTIGMDSVKGYTYRWSPKTLVGDSTKSLTTFMGKNIGATILTQQLVLTTTRLGGCITKDTVIVRINPAFTVDAGVDKVICQRDKVKIGSSPTAKGGTGTYLYRWTPTTGLSDSTASNPDAAPSVTTVYKVTVTYNGCVKKDSVKVTVLTIPKADAGNNNTICKGDTVILGGSVPGSGTIGPYSYQWSPSIGLSSITAAHPSAYPANTTNYILKVTDGKGCSNYDTVTVNVNNIPTVDPGSNKIICAKDSVQLGGSPTVTGGKSPYTYSWSPSTGLNNTSVANPYAKPLTTTLYTLLVTDANGCKSNSKVTVTVNALPTVKAGNNREICRNDTTTLGGSPTASGGGGSYTYAWSPNTSISSTSVSNPKVYPKTTTKYRLTVTDAKGCKVNDSVTVTVNQLPVIEAGAKDTMCESDTIQLKATSGGSYTYRWSPGKYTSDSTALKPRVFPVKTTSFILAATDNKGCISKDTIQVYVRPRKALNPPKLVCVSVQDSGHINITWDTVGANSEFREYRLYRLSGATVSLVSTFARTATTYSDAGINDANKKQYGYYLVTVNKCFTVSKTSDTIKTVVLTAVQSGDKILNLSWTAPVKGTLTYTVEADDGTGFKKLADIKGTSYRIISCNKKAAYRISVSPGAGCTAYSNKSKQINLRDNTPPNTNALLYATVKDLKTILIYFQSSDSADVKEYEIARATNSGVFSTVFTVKPGGKFITYTDNTVAADKNSYTYKVRAVDTCGNASVYTKAHIPVLLQGTAGNYEANLSWKTYQGFVIKRQEVQRWKSGKWVAIKSLTIADSGFTDKPLTCNVPQYYRIYTVGTDSSLTSVSDSVRIVPFDTVKPAVPVISYVTIQGDTAVTLKWKKVSDIDVRNYIVLRKGLNEAIWKTVATVGNVDTYSEKILSPKDSVWEFAVKAMDSCAGNTSAQSVRHNTLRLRVSLNKCEQAIYLNWNSYKNWKDGVNYYRIYRTKLPGSETFLDSTNSLGWKDASIDYHFAYRYRIEAVEKNGTSISSSNTDTIRTIDPGMPVIITATKQNSSLTMGRILVKWNISKPSPFAKYRNLYYRIDKDSAFKPLALKLSLNTDTFLHIGLNTRTGYYEYFMQTVDSCGLASDSSSEHVPVDLTVQVGQLVHDLSWTPYKGWPVKNYVVQKWINGTFKDVDTLAGNITSLHKFPAPCNTDIFYRIKTIGPTGQISYSDTMGGRAIDSVPADAATLQNVSVLSGKSVRVDFTGADSLDIYAYAIQRGEKGKWSTSGQILFTTPHDAYTYKDNTNTLDNQLCYVIVTLDSCLNATYSDTFCTIQLKGKGMNLSNHPEWQPFRGYSINKYYLQDYTATGWDTLAVLNGTDTSYLHSPLPCNVPVTYRVIGQNIATGLVTYSDSNVLVPYDTIRPVAPKTDYISVMDGKRIEAYWNLSPDKDVKEYELQLRTANGPWQAMDTVVLKTSYVFTGLNTLDSTYSFRVVAIDSCAANRSLLQPPHTAIQLKGQPKNLSNQLNWSAYQGFAITSYDVLRWKGNTWQKLTTVAGTQTDYLDTGLQCNIPYQYKIKAFAATGGFVSFSDSISLTPYDTTRPPAHDLVYTTVLDGARIKASWNKSVPDVKLYQVSLQENGGPWKIIDTLDRQFTYTFTGLNTLQKNYCVRIAAIDSCAENISINNNPHCVIQLDGKPLNLSNELTWSAYGGAPVQQYYIYEYRNGWKLLDSVSQTSANYIHKNLPCNVPVNYRIGGKLVNGFISMSDTIQLTPFDTLKPAAPSMRYASVQNDRSIKLQWDWNKTTDVKYFEVWRQENSGAWNKVSTAVYDSQYVDKTVLPNAAYKYYLIAIDSCSNLNRSLPSDTDVVVNLFTHTGGCKPYAKLRWTPYMELPGKVDSYEIYRSIDSINYTLVQTNTSANLNYVDSAVSEGITYLYRIRAVDKESGYSSYSDTMAITPWIFPKPKSTEIYFASVTRSDAVIGSVHIAWKGYDFKADTFAAGYRLYFATSPAGPYQVTYKTFDPLDTSYTQTGLNTQTGEYWYKVIVFNRCDVEGPGSVVHKPLNLTLDNRNLEIDLSWKKYEGTAVAGYDIYRSVNGNTPRIISSLSDADTIYADRDIRCEQRYTYALRARLKNGYASISDTESVTSFDTIPPPRPDIYFISVDSTLASGGLVSVVYQGNTEINRSGYRIYLQGANGKFVPVADQMTTKPDTLYWQQGSMNTTKGPHSFYVVSLDSCGNVSMPSDTHTTVFLKAVAKSMYLQLDWSAYAGFQQPYKYHLVRRQPGKPWVEIANFDMSTLSYRDSNVTCHEFYEYEVRTQETSGSLSLSNISGDTAFETELPEPPVIIRATVTSTGKIAGVIVVNWHRSISSDVALYHVYRSIDGQNWVRVGTNITDTFFVSQYLATISTSYWFAVKSEDKCGNLSNIYGIPHKTILLQAVPGNQEVQLTWNAYTGRQPAGYKIYRGGALLADVTASTQFFLDTMVLCGTNYWYQVQAYFTGKDSTLSSSNTVNAIPWDTKPPLRAYLATATVSLPNKAVTLYWQPSPSWDVQGYRIWRRSGVTGEIKLIDSTSGTSYTDSLGEISSPDCYLVEAYDQCGNGAQKSNLGCIMLLTGRNERDRHTLSWNPYREWKNGVETYTIYRNDDSTGWKQLGATSFEQYDDYLYQDSTVSDFCYRVEAKETNSNATSFSTVTCLHQEPYIFIPNAFTPQITPSVNDKFGPKGLYIPSYTMRIYNRWGQLVYQTTDGKAWDGTIDGKLAPEGVYLYTIEVNSLNKNRQWFKGLVTVLR
jgi:gliding motility-associated-like protein